MKSIPILKLAIETEQNVVDARQRTRQIAAAIGLDNQDQVRVATAVSELARNAFQYAQGGVVEFGFQIENRPQLLTIKVTDHGEGIKDLDRILAGDYTSTTGMGVGLLGARKLSDRFEIETTSKGTTVHIGKNVPPRRPITTPDLARLAELLHRERPSTPYQEVQRQNTELLQTLDELQTQQNDLHLLNRELAETNRGVVALYAELDEKANAIQKANEVKTSFLSNMTHEFRTPLTSIISLTRLLTERIDGDLTPEQEKQVLYIRKSAEGLLELVGDLLDLAKVEAGRINLNIEDADVLEILGTLRGVFRPILADSPVEFIVDMTHHMPMLQSDDGKISQILRNLVSNALKFTEKGSVTVSAEHTPDDHVLFRVTDTGLGIDKENIDRIFEDFSQVDSKLQKRNRGTGLGLPLSRKLARLLGGDVWVESTLGVGSTFFVKIPRIYKGESEAQLITQSQVHAQAVAPQPSSKVPTILIIDDDETSRYVLKNLIRTFTTANFIESDTPRSSVGLVTTKQPDLVFLDLTMPEKDGFDVLRDLKSNPDTETVPVCINTAKILTPDETDFLSQLAIGILSKERSNVARSNSELRKVLVDAHLLPALAAKETPV